MVFAFLWQVELHLRIALRGIIKIDLLLLIYHAKFSALKTATFALGQIAYLHKACLCAQGHTRRSHT